MTLQNIQRLFLRNKNVGGNNQEPHQVHRQSKTVIPF